MRVFCFNAHFHFEMCRGAAPGLLGSNRSLIVPPCSVSAGHTAPQDQGAFVETWLDNCKAEGRTTCHLPLLPWTCPSSHPFCVPETCNICDLIKPTLHESIWDASLGTGWGLVSPDDQHLGDLSLGSQGPFGLGYIFRKGLKFTLLTPSSVEVNHGSTLREVKDFHQKT